MGYGGTGHIKSFKYNRSLLRKRDRRLEDRIENYLGKSKRSVGKLLDKKATPEQLKSIGEKLQKENRWRMIKGIGIMVFVTASIVTSVIYLLS